MYMNASVIVIKMPIYVYSLLRSTVHSIRLIPFWFHYIYEGTVLLFLHVMWPRIQYVFSVL
jgi:hypothetical protein